MGKHLVLLPRTSAHLRASASGLFIALLLVCAAGFSALVRWPAQARTFGLQDAVERVRQEPWHQYAPIVLATAGALAVVALVYSMYRARRWRVEREINRVSLALQSTDPSMTDPPTDQRHFRNDVPPPLVQWVSGSRRGMPKLRRLTTTTNVIGAPRLEITYLRLFDNNVRQVSFVLGTWREFGTVSMLRSAVSTTIRDVKRCRRAAASSRCS